jgi:ParB family chromosome partitioning protein
VVRRSGLGRGLGALIPPDVAASAAGAEGSSDLREVLVGSIRPNRNQPRQSFAEESLVSLAASISELGVLQPVLVRPMGEEDGQAVFELIAGERRWRAAKRAGLVTIPAIVRDVSDETSVEQAVVENLHRDDLNPMEEAAAYTQLLEDFSLTHDQLAKRVGKSRAAVSNLLRLFQLPTTVQRMVRDGEITEGHARALLGSPDRSFIEGLAKRIVAEGLTVRATEEAVRARAGRAEPPDDATADVPPAPTSPRPPGTTKEPGLLELENLLGDLLQTKVTVELRQHKGRVVVEFADLDDLERIYRAMTGA